MLFSRETKSFVMGGSSSESDKVQEFLPEDGGKVGVSTSNMDKDLICMLQRTWASSVTKGWALMIRRNFILQILLLVGNRIL